MAKQVRRGVEFNSASDNFTDRSTRDPELLRIESGARRTGDLAHPRHARLPASRVAGMTFRFGAK